MSMVVCLLIATMLNEAVEVDDGMIHEWLRSVVSSGGIPGEFVGDVEAELLGLAAEELFEGYRVGFDGFVGKSNEKWLVWRSVHLGRVFLIK